MIPPRGNGGVTKETNPLRFFVLFSGGHGTNQERLTEMTGVLIGRRVEN